MPSSLNIRSGCRIGLHRNSGQLIRKPCSFGDTRKTLPQGGDLCSIGLFMAKGSDFAWFPTVGDSFANHALSDEMRSCGEARMERISSAAHERRSRGEARIEWILSAARDGRSRGGRYSWVASIPCLRGSRFSLECLAFSYLFSLS